MFNRYIPLFAILLLTHISVSSAADDPLKSLFLFQKQMADKGSSSAMMKLGEMYERGDGVEQSNENALKMFEKAKSAGHKGSDEAIQRIKNAGNKSAAAKKREEQERKKAEAKKQQEELARQKAEEQRQLAIKEKAAREKAAQENAEKERLAKIKAEKARAEQNKAAAAKVAAEKAAAAKAAAEDVKAKQARILAEKKRRQEERTANQDKDDTEGFKSDPCKSPAARLLSICKK